MKVLTIANCQQTPIESILRFSGIDAQRAVKPIHELDEQSAEEVGRQIESADVVLLQHNVAKKYADFGLSPEAMRSRHSNVLVIPSIYFPGYHPTFTSVSSNDLKWQAFAELIESNHFGPQIDLLPIVACQKGVSAKQLIAWLESTDVSRDDSLTSEVYAGLQEREAFCDIKVSDYIQSNASRKVLFFTFNHPINELFVELCQRVTDRLGMNTKISSRIKPYLSNYRPPIFPAVAGLFGVFGDTEWPIGGGSSDHDMNVVVSPHSHLENTASWFSAHRDEPQMKEIFSRWSGTEAYKFANKVADRLVSGGRS